MDESKDTGRGWFRPLRIIAAVLVLALIISFITPSAGIFSRASGDDEPDPAEASPPPAESFDTYYALANTAISEGSYQDAVSYLERARELSSALSDKQKAELSLKTASVYILIGENDRAYELLEEALSLDGASAQAFLLRAQLSIDTGQYSAAIPDLRAYAELSPEDLETRLALAQLLENLGDYRGAAAEFEKLFAEHPEDASHRLNSLRCLFLTGDTQGAISGFDDFLAQTEADSPYLPIAEFLRAACFMQLGDMQQAEAGFLSAMDKGYDRADCLEQLVLCSFEREDYAKTVEYGEGLVELGSEGTEPGPFKLRMGASLMLLERYEEAITYLDAAEELDSSLSGCNYYRGVSLLALERYGEAAEDFGKSIEEGFLTQFCYYNRGVCYVQLLEYDKALEDMKMTLSTGNDAELITAAEEIIIQIEAYNEAVAAENTG